MAPPLANTPASGSQQAARAQPKGSLRLLSATTAKSISEVKPSNKRGAHQFIAKPTRSSKEIAVFSSESSTQRLFMKKTIVFQRRLNTFVMDFMHFERDMAED